MKYTLLLALLFASQLWAQDKEPAVKDRKAFLPYQKHQPLSGKVVGILIASPTELLANEGRSGPPDQVCFAHGLVSYRWVYVTTNDANPQISDLRVRAGEKGDIELNYPKLRIANPASLQPFGVADRYCLVEMEINEGKGSPAEDAFVATGVFVVEGSKKYPFKVAEVIDKVTKRHREWTKSIEKEVDKSLADVTTKTLGDRQPSNPRQTSDLIYVTWLPETESIRVHFRTKHTLGDFKEVEGGGVVPQPLPPPGGKNPPAPGLPPLQRFRVRVGVSFGIEFGRAYEVSKAGDITVVERLPLEPFVDQQAAPPIGIGRGRGGPD